MTWLRNTLLALVLGVFGAASFNATSAASQANATQEIKAIIDEIKSESSDRSRYELAYKLQSIATCVAPTDQLDDATIRDIASFVNDDYTRLQALTVLTALGRRAHVAMPTLINSLKLAKDKEYRDIKVPAVSDFDSIGKALVSVGGLERAVVAYLDLLDSDSSANAQSQYYVSKRLAGLVNLQSSDAALTENTVDRVAALLNDPNSRVWAAQALMGIGIQADRAIPLLNRASQTAKLDHAFNREMKSYDYEIIEAALRQLRHR